MPLSISPQLLATLVLSKLGWIRTRPASQAVPSACSIKKVEPPRWQRAANRRWPERPPWGADPTAYVFVKSPS